MADVGRWRTPLTDALSAWLSAQDRLKAVVAKIDGPYNGQIFVAKGYSLADLQAELREIAALGVALRDGG
jgi:hypothetical protein